MRYRDIPQFSRARYSVDISWSFLEEWLSAQVKECVDFQLDPDFQRHHVWDDTKRTRYVEYILRGGHSSYDIYFNCANYTGFGTEGAMQLVDGKQRLDAVRKWLANEIPAFDVYKRDMVGRMGLGGARFHVNVNDLATQEEVLQWYLDLNEGGVAHTEAELAKVRAMLAAETSLIDGE